MLIEPSPRARRAFVRFVTVALLASSLAITALPAAEAKGPGRILVLEGVYNHAAASLAAVGYAPCGGGNCYDVAPPALFALMTPADWAPYSVLYVGWLPDTVTVNALQAQEANIKQWLSEGGSIIANPERPTANGVDGFRWIPDGTQAAVAYVNQNQVQYTTLGTIHPALLGISPSQLSNWGNSVHNHFVSWPAYLQPIVRTNSGQEAVVAGHYGLGCILLSGLDVDFHAAVGHSGARAWLGQLMRWAYACECVDHICEPSVRVFGLEAGLPDLPVREVDAWLAREPTPPRYAGPVTVEAATCRCIVTGVQLTSSVLTDVFPANDGLFPTLAQTTPHEWVVTSPDTDTYSVTFRLNLSCPNEEGGATTKVITKSWIMGP